MSNYYSNSFCISFLKLLEEAFIVHIDEAKYVTFAIFDNLSNFVIIRKSLPKSVFLPHVGFWVVLIRDDGIDI